jgi:hypothetical protein
MHVRDLLDLISPDAGLPPMARSGEGATGPRFMEELDLAADRFAARGEAAKAPGRDEYREEIGDEIGDEIEEEFGYNGLAAPGSDDDGDDGPAAASRASLRFRATASPPEAPKARR